MIIREIKGYEYEAHIGESVIKETLKEELNSEVVDFISRIEETANDIIDLRYVSEDVEKESVKFAQDILMEMYNYIKANKNIDVLSYINETFIKLNGWTKQ